MRSFPPTASDEPTGLGGTDTAPNPVEQLLSALGNCLLLGYAANASAVGIAIKDLKIAVDGDVDLRSFLGLAPGHAGFSAIRVRVDLDTDADAEAVAELHRKVAASSPVGHTLQAAVPIEITPGLTGLQPIVRSSANDPGLSPLGGPNPGEPTQGKSRILPMFWRCRMRR